MRSYEDHKKILELWEQGYNKVQIARMTGIPRRTVTDCIKRYESIAGLKQAMGKNTSTYENYETAKEILTLWEKGHTKTDIAKITGISRYHVTNCIERYRSVAQLNNAVNNDESISFTPKTSKISDRERSRRSGNRGYSDNDVVQAVKKSTSLRQTLIKLGLKPAGGNYATLKKTINELGLDTSHFRGKGWLKGEQVSIKVQIPLEKILVENSTYSNSSALRQRLIQEGIFIHKCSSCNLNTWKDKPIPLELDHINGDNRDHRLENLRLLCPNCHAMTSTYRGKNISVGDDE